VPLFFTTREQFLKKICLPFADYNISYLEGDKFSRANRPVESPPFLCRARSILQICNCLLWRRRKEEKGRRSIAYYYRAHPIHQAELPSSKGGGFGRITKQEGALFQSG
jgi:hypothetical protein